MNEVCQAAVITNGTVTNAIFAEESSVVTLVANEKDCFVDLDVIAIGAGGNYASGTGAGAGSGMDTSRLGEFVSPSTVRPCI